MERFERKLEIHGNRLPHLFPTNSVSALGIVHRSPLPWDEMRTTMLRTGADALPVIVNRHLEKCVSPFYAFCA